MSSSESSTHRCEGVSRIFKNSMVAILQFRQQIDESHGGKSVKSSEDVTLTQTQNSKSGGAVRKVKSHSSLNTASQHATQSPSKSEHTSCNSSTGAARKTPPKEKNLSPRRKRSVPVKRKVVESPPATDTVKEKVGKEESKREHNQKSKVVSSQPSTDTVKEKVGKGESKGEYSKKSKSTDTLKEKEESKRDHNQKSKVVGSQPLTNTLKNKIGKEESKREHNRLPKVTKRTRNKATVHEREVSNLLLHEKDTNNNLEVHQSTMEIPQRETGKQCDTKKLSEDKNNSNKTSDRIDGRSTFQSIGRQSNEVAQQCYSNDNVKVANNEINDGNKPIPNESVDKCISKGNDLTKPLDNKSPSKHPSIVTRDNPRGHLVWNENVSGRKCLLPLPTAQCAPVNTPAHVGRHCRSNKPFNQDEVTNTSRHPRWKGDNFGNQNNWTNATRHPHWHWDSIAKCAPRDERNYASRPCQRQEHRPRGFGNRRYESRRYDSHHEHEPSKPNISLPVTECVKDGVLPVSEDWSVEANANSIKNESSIKPLMSVCVSVKPDTTVASVAPVSTDSIKDTEEVSSQSPYLPPPPPPEEEELEKISKKEEILVNMPEEDIILVNNPKKKETFFSTCKKEEILGNNSEKEGIPVNILEDKEVSVDSHKKEDFTLIKTSNTVAEEQLFAVGEFQDGLDSSKTAESLEGESPMISPSSDQEIFLESKASFDKSETNSIVVDEPVRDIPHILQTDSNSIVFLTKSPEENTVRSCISSKSSKSERSNTTLWTDKSGNEVFVSESNQADISDNECTDSSCQGHEYISCRSKTESEKQSDKEYQCPENVYASKQLPEKDGEENKSSEYKPGWNVAHPQNYEGYLNWYQRQMFMNVQWMRYLEWCRYNQNRMGNNPLQRSPGHGSVTSNVSMDMGQNINNSGIPRHCNYVKETLHNKASSDSKEPKDSRLSDYWTEKLPDWVDSQTAGSVDVKLPDACGDQEPRKVSGEKEKQVHKFDREEKVDQKRCINQKELTNGDQKGSSTETFIEEKKKDSVTAGDVEKESTSPKLALHCDCKPAQVQYLVWRMCICDAGNPPKLHQILPGHRDENIVHLVHSLHEPPEAEPYDRAQQQSIPPFQQSIPQFQQSIPQSQHSTSQFQQSTSLSQQSTSQSQHSTAECLTNQSTVPPQTRTRHTHETGTVRIVRDSRNTHPPGFSLIPADKNRSGKALLHSEDSESKNSLKCSNKLARFKSDKARSRPAMESTSRCMENRHVNESEDKSSSNQIDLACRLDPNIRHGQSTVLKEQVVLSVENVQKGHSYSEMPDCLQKSVGHLANVESELKKAGPVQARLGSVMETITKAISVIQQTLHSNPGTLTADLLPAEVTVNALAETSKEQAGNNKGILQTILENTTIKVENNMEMKDGKTANIKDEHSKFESKFKESRCAKYKPGGNGEPYKQEGHSAVKSISSNRMKGKCVGAAADRKFVCPEDEYCAVSVDDGSDATGLPIASQSPAASDEEEGEIKENEFLIPDSQAGFGYHPGGRGQEWFPPGNGYPPFVRSPPSRYRMPPWHNYRPMGFPPPPVLPPPTERWMPPYFPHPQSLPIPPPWNRYSMNCESSPRSVASQERYVRQYCEYPSPSGDVREVDSTSSKQRKTWMMKRDDTMDRRKVKLVDLDQRKVKLVDYGSSDDNDASDDNEFDVQNSDDDLGEKDSSPEACSKPTSKKQRTENGLPRDNAEENVEGNGTVPCLTRKVSGKLKQKTLKMYFSPDNPAVKSAEKRTPKKETSKEVSTKSANTLVPESSSAVNNCQKENEDINFLQEFPELSKIFSPGCLPSVANQSLPPLPPFPGSPFWGMYLPGNTSALSGNSQQSVVYPQQGRENRPMSARRDQHRTKIYSRRSWPLTFQGNTALSSSDSESLLQSDWKTKFKQFHSFGVKYIDTHCHLDFLFNREGFHGNLRKYMDEHSETFPDMFAGCVAVFCNPSTFTPNGGLWLEVAKEDNVWIAMGCHPKMALDFTPEAEHGLRNCLSHHKCIALGEIGLDYSGTFQQHAAVQKEVFRKQLKMALKKDKPLVIHCRDAEQDCLDILKEVVPRNYKIHCHCFTGYYSNAQLWMDAFPNLYIGVTPLVTYRTAHPSHDLARKIPLGRLLLETDAPYFIPRCIPKEELPYSTPGLAVVVAKEIAKYQELPVAAVLRQCRLNTKFMYGI